ncbi:MAG: DUF3298 and DUF4163 domain-containing protein [Fervidobacterium sp.]|nr:DUF3298 and DUF4163 domain-containing protein [Fervidobacterium sp.]
MPNNNNPQKRFYILAIILLIAIFAYMYTIKSQKIELIQSSTKNNTIQITISMPKLKNLDNIRFQEELNTIIESRIKQFIKQVKEIADQNKKEGIPTQPYEANISTNIHYQDENLACFIIYYYQYTGGAHGITTFETYNIDLKSSKLLNLNNIIEKEAEKIIKQQIVNQIKLNQQNFFPEATDYILKDNLFTRSFIIEPKYITFIYPYYEIAPYSSGMPMFFIPWQNISQYIKHSEIKKIAK